MFAEVVLFVILDEVCWSVAMKSVMHSTVGDVVDVDRGKQY